MHIAKGSRARVPALKRFKKKGHFSILTEERTHMNIECGYALPQLGLSSCVPVPQTSLMEQHASTSYDDRRHTTTQEQTHASQQGMDGREVGRDRTEII